MGKKYRRTDGRTDNLNVPPALSLTRHIDIKRLVTILEHQYLDLSLGLFVNAANCICCLVVRTRTKSGGSKLKLRVFFHQARRI